MENMHMGKHHMWPVAVAMLVQQMHVEDAICSTSLLQITACQAPKTDRSDQCYGLHLNDAVHLCLDAIYATPLMAQRQYHM